MCALVAETSGLLSSAALRQVDCVICNSSWALEGGFAVILVGARAARGDKIVRKERRREGGGRTGAPSGPLHLSPSGSLLMCIRPLARVTLIRRLNQKFQLLETLHSYAFSAHHSFMFTSLGEPYTPCARCAAAPPRCNPNLHGGCESPFSMFPSVLRCASLVVGCDRGPDGRRGMGDRTGAELTHVSLLHSKRLGGNTTPSKPQDVRLHNVGLHDA